MSLELVTPARPERFAQTSVSTQIEAAVEFAILTRSAVAARGKPGIGKSSTIGKLLASEDTFVAAFEIPAGSGSPRHLVKSICAALGVPDWDGQHIGAILSRVRDHQRFSVSCLIVDEIQNADAAGIRMLLSLNEHGSLPIVVIGNPEALKHKGASNAAWAQITDRVTKFVDLEASLIEDTTAVARAWGAGRADTLKVVLAFAETHSLRKIVQLLRTAHALSEGNEELTVGDVEVALRYIGAPSIKHGEAA